MHNPSQVVKANVQTNRLTGSQAVRKGTSTWEFNLLCCCHY